ncbi:transporter substrate-binding domain-containing protein [Variovorax sp. RA8]|uniref:transporter substrate-binding domain-containing protein n=1 Tax=Variovorax sp. (strain JCM 16519 / RA8) TaxID=662548 RepID=UPI001317CFCD|nr:transporter substrate-binding domain-containing protein [Variovorax sp. RA8]VTU34381.1 Glutamate/aspartate periplasmic-binding protein precursor [Variovorax sp. RA8]
MNILKATALSLALTLSGFAFAGETIDKLKETKTITFGSRDTSVPYSYADAQGRYVGYSQDLGMEFKRFIEKKYNLDLTVNKVSVNGQTRQPLVVNKVIELETGSTSYTEERAKAVNFMIVDADPVVPAVLSTDTSIKSLEDFKGKTVAVVAGTTGEKIFKKLNAEKGWGTTLVLAKDYPQGYLLVEQGRAVGLVTNSVLLAGEIAKLKTTKFKVLNNVVVGEAELIGIMYGKQDAEFTADFKEFEAKVKSDGTLEKLYTKWFAPLGLKWTPEQRKAVLGK